MITLALLKLLELNGFGKIGVDLFWQKIGSGKQGIYITNISAGGYDRGLRKIQDYEIYSVGKNNIQSLKKIEAIADFLRSSYNINSLPEVDGVEFKNITILPTTSVSSTGLNSKGEMLYSISGTIYY